MTSFVAAPDIATFLKGSQKEVFVKWKRKYLSSVYAKVVKEINDYFVQGIINIIYNYSDY